MRNIHFVIQIRDRQTHKYRAFVTFISENYNVWSYLQGLNSTRQEVVTANVYTKKKCVALASAWNKGFKEQGKLWE